MSGNGFGEIFRLTTFGESHGSAIGCVVEGVPSNIPLSEQDIQIFLDKRKPSSSSLTTQRKESDTVHILSGVFDGKTTGTPIALFIENTDQHSADYTEISEKFRPSHADVAYFLKYGNRDYRGGGRASARETALRVAAGALARKVISKFLNGFDITAALVQVGTDKISAFDKNEISKNALFCPDATAAQRFAKQIESARADNNSLPAVVAVVATGFPAGLGEPVFDKLDADLAKALMSINAAKGVEIGDGFGVLNLTGQENADEMYADPASLNRIGFYSNHAGGILGGLSSGQPIAVRVVFKPTPSVARPLRTVDKNLNDTTVVTKGRHDPCVGIRAVPVVEAMTACVLADHLLRYRAQYDF